MLHKNKLKVSCKQIQHIVRTTLAAVALLTAANPETKAQFVPAVGTIGNDTITGSGTFTGSLNATQGGVDTITVLGGSTITFGGATPNMAIIDAGLGTITVGADSTLIAPGAGQRGIYSLSTVLNPGNTQSTSVTNAAQITADNYCIYADISNLIATGSAAVTISNSGVLNSVNSRGISATASGQVSGTVNIQNSGDINSLNECIFAQANAFFGAGGDASVNVSNSGTLSSANNQGIEAIALGVSSATASVQNTGDITAALEAVRILADTTPAGATGDSLVIFSNSGNLVSNGDDGVELLSNSRNNATISFNNSGSVQTNAGGAFYGIYAIADATLGTGGVATISGSNSGQVTASNISSDAIRLEALGNLGANISFSNSGNLTALFNNGLTAYADTTLSPSDANASTIISNSGIIIAGFFGIDAESIANGDAIISVSNSGDITAGNIGMYAYARADFDGNAVGNGSITVTNTGTINAGTWGIYVNGLNSPEAEVYNLYGSITTSANDAIFIHPNVGVNRTWLVGGNISAGGGGMVFQGNGNSTLYVINNPQLNGGMMDGGNPGNTSQIKFKLVGMSPKEAKKAKAQMGNSAGSFSINGGKLQYNWQDFDGGSSGTFISLQTKVDKSLVPTAKWLDKNAYKFVDNADIGKFYLAAGDKPGEMIANLMGQAEALARNDVLLEYSNLVANAVFSLGYEFAAGYAAGLINLSTLNFYRPDVLMAGNAILNRLDRISDTPVRSPRKTPVQNVSPWSVWIGGNAIVATLDKWEDRAGYDNFTTTPLLGLSYRPSANTSLGIIGGPTITKLDFTNNSTLKGTGMLVAIHGTQRLADFYTSVFVGGGITEFEQQRRIMGRTAHSGFTSMMLTTGANMGYGIKLGNLTLTPELGLVYTHLQHGNYQETGAGVFNRQVASSEVDSLKSRLGGRISYLFEIAKGQVAPYVYGAWSHELLYDNNEAPVRLPRFGMPYFEIGNDNPERDSALVGVGINGKLHKQSPLSWYIAYEANIGASQYVSHTGSLGIRLDF